NTKSELNYVDPNLRQEDFLSIFNKIASSIEDGTNLFSEDDLFSVLKELTEDNATDSSEELEDLVSENLLNLKVKNFISLSSKLESNESLNMSEDIIHGNKNFDVNDLISDTVNITSFRYISSSRVNITPKNICEQILNLAKKDMTPSQIAVNLQGMYNIRPTRNITVNKILRILMCY
ncbi:5406_t:CDS:2, partial [Racocetra fulgida]